MSEDVDRKNVAFIWVGWERSGLGLRGRVGEQLGGESVLARTVRRVRAHDRLRDARPQAVVCRRRRRRPNAVLPHAALRRTGPGQ